MSVVIVAILVAGSALATTSTPRQLPSENLAAAQVLLPLLEDLHKRLQPRFRAGPGTLPPSPFTGRPAAAAALTIGRKKVDVDPEVMLALEKLVKWDPTTAPESLEAMLFDEWLDYLKIKTGAMIAIKVEQLTCDTACVTERLTKLDHAFGRSRREREELRDYLMLEALTAAVK